MRTTNVTSAQIEMWLGRVLAGTLLFVAFAVLLFSASGFDLPTILAILALVLVELVLLWRTPRLKSSTRALLLSLLDLLIVTGLFFLLRGRSGPDALLIFPVVALAAARLALENVLILATIGSLLFSLNLPLPTALPDLAPDPIALVVYLVLTYALAFIVHFAVTGQREAEGRRQSETALAEARRLIDQEQMLVQLSRDITNAASLGDTLEIVLDTIHRFVLFEGGSIALLDARDQLYVAASLPEVDAEVKRLHLPRGQGIGGWIIDKREPFYAPDLDSETRVPPAFRNVGSNARSKSYLGVPLITRGRCIGVLQVDSAQVGAFTGEHRRLLQAVAAQVSGAIANARLLEERDEFSVRLQAAYTAANELTSHFDLDFILQQFVQCAGDLLGTRYAAAATLNEQKHIEKFVTVGMEEAERGQLGPLPEGHGLLGEAFKQQKTVRIDDISQSPNAVGFPSHHPVMHTLLAAPLVSRGEIQGAIYLADKLDGQLFSQADEDLLMILSAGASAAISNARLYTQLRRNIEQLYALHQIGEAIGASLSPEDVFHVFNVDVRNLCGAEASVVSEWNTAGNYLHVQSQDGDTNLLKARNMPAVKREINQAARGQQAISFSLDLLDGQGQLYGYLAPLIVRGQAFGLAEIYSHTNAVISPESSSIFLTLAAQLAVSMENARLYTTLQKREQQLRDFVGRLFQAEDGERRRLAYEIHDGLAQLIVSADMHLNNFASMRGEDSELAEQQLDKGLKRLKTSLAEVRRVVSELRPSALDDFGLVNTLRRYVEQVAEEQGWEYTFDENLGEERLDPAIETGAYRIVQESLNNIRKYSETPRVEVELKQAGDFLRVRVQDWGKGFDLEEARQREGHFGLSSMEERARLLGGKFQIDTRPGEGTRIDVELPCYRAVPTVRK